MPDIKERAELWWADLIRSIVNHEGGVHGAQRLVAEKLGVDPSQVNRWMTGGNDPRLSTVMHVLTQLKGDLDRALPTYEAPTTGEEIGLPLLGRVSAGPKRLPGGAIGWVPGISPDAFRHRPYWTITTGPVVLLQVDGDSMWPDYQDGELIACRAPYNHRELQNGMPCIFRELEGVAFKFLEWVPLDGEPHKRVPIGRPANHRYPAVRFESPADVRIDYVVLGRAGELGVVSR